MERFVSGEIRSVDVAYMKFISAGKQIPVVERLLPLSALEPEDAERPAEAEVRVRVLAGSAELLDELLPATVRMRCFRPSAMPWSASRWRGWWR